MEKTANQLRDQFLGRDPRDHNNDMVDSMAGMLDTKLISFAGRNGAGACTLVGAAVGDRVLSVAGLSAADLGDTAASFESVITVVNQIQQVSVGNLSANAYLALLAPPASH